MVVNWITDAYQTDYFVKRRGRFQCICGEDIEASLVNLDRAIDTTDKGIGSQESDGTSQQEIHCTGEEAVAEEQQGRHKSSDVQLEHVVPDAVGEDPEGTAATCQEALPPPVVVL